MNNLRSTIREYPLDEKSRETVSKSQIAREQWIAFYRANHPIVAQAFDVAVANHLNETETLKLVICEIIGQDKVSL